MNSNEVGIIKTNGFDGRKYIELQKAKIYERIDKFNKGKLYLEIGGKFLHDPHAARVLPGYDVDSKQHILGGFKNIADIIFCVNAKAIQSNQQLENTDTDYIDVVETRLEEIETKLQIKPIITINLIDGDVSKHEKVMKFSQHLKNNGYTVLHRYLIPGYPNNVDTILSDDGYGKDDFHHSKKNLIIVVGATANSGKMSTALGQIFHDRKHGLHSGYAKFETFPIWSLPIDHPVNLAYEAATADIGDYNVVDPFHLKAYNKVATNYNRDVEAFPILQKIIKELVDAENPMHAYKSPTDMGVNTAGFAITSDHAVCLAALAEIKRRTQWYQEMVGRGEGKQEWVEKCELLYSKAERYIRMRRY